MRRAASAFSESLVAAAASAGDESATAVVAFEEDGGVGLVRAGVEAERSGEGARGEVAGRGEGPDDGAAAAGAVEGAAGAVFSPDVSAKFLSSAKKRETDRVAASTSEQAPALACTRRDAVGSQAGQTGGVEVGRGDFEALAPPVLHLGPPQAFGLGVWVPDRLLGHELLGHHLRRWKVCVLERRRRGLRKGLLEHDRLLDERRVAARFGRVTGGSV